MKIWAYGTSPHGLGLSGEELWALSYREYAALCDVANRPVKRWAIERAQFANAHFRAKNDGVPFEPEDFLGTGDREERIKQAMLSKLAVDKENRRLDGMTRGKMPANLPDWAKRVN